MKLSSPLLVLVSEALPSQPHEPDTISDSGIQMDFVDVPILCPFCVETFVTKLALLLLIGLVYLHVILQLHQSFETLSTFVTRLRLTVAVDLPHMPLDHPLVRAGVVTTLLVVTLVYLDISALFLVI